MPLPNLPFARFTSSRQLIPGSRENDIADLFTSFQGAITALAGGARSALTPVLNATFCEITTVVTGADSVVLPIAKVGLNITVTNSGANSAQVFANGTDVMFPGNVAGSVGLALAAAATADYVCTKAGRWTRYTSA